MSPGFRIVLLCIGASVLYGLVMDQITARVCLEYFTVAHPQIIRTDSPTLIALYWGVAATWWMGLMLGVPLAMAAQAGSWPRIGHRQLIRPLGVLLLVMAAGTLAAGITGYGLAKNGKITPEDWQWKIPEAAHNGFVADAFAHLAAYILGFFGGLLLILLTVYRRKVAAARTGGMNAAPL